MKYPDVQGRMVRRLMLRLEKWNVRFGTARTYFNARILGVKIGPNCHFFGVPRFSREVDSHISIGSDCQFRSAVWANKVGLNRPCMISTLYPGAKVEIGDRVGMSGTVVAAACSISIGADVLCGGNVTICDTDWHEIDPEHRRTRGRECPVVIEDNVWLGLNVIVLKGVTIGKDSIIGAGSVVVRSIPPRSIAVGQPARVLKSL